VLSRPESTVAREEDAAPLVGAAPSRAGRSRDGLGRLCVLAVAAGYVLITLRHNARFHIGMPSPDIYGAQYPMLVYFWRSLQRGHGYLWNSLQNCGEPMLPATPPGTLYPLNLLMAVVGIDAFYPAIALVHLAIGGLFVYQLCREYEAPPVAAMAGAFAFELGAPAVHLSTWVPSANLGAYVWLPGAILLVERILRAPRLGLGVWLGVVLSMSLLAGCPQITFFIYQLVLLRLVWQLFTGPLLRWPIVAALGVGLVLPFFLGAIQLLPSLELVRLSVRPSSLSAHEIEPLARTPWETFLDAFKWHPFTAPLFTVASATLASLAWLLPGRRRMATFYGLVIALYFALAMQTPLFTLYQALPLGRLFRLPSRFLWPAWFATCVLIGLGVGALAARDPAEAAPAPRRRLWRLAFPVLTLVMGAVYVSLVVNVPPWEIASFAAILVVTGWAAFSGGGKARAAFASTILLVGLSIAARAPFLRFLTDDSTLTERRAAFQHVHSMMGPGDRILVHAPASDFSLMPKSGTLFDIRVVSDYEPQTARRFAELWVRMTLGRRIENLSDYYMATGALPNVSPLVNLVSARYILLPEGGFNPARWTPKPIFQLHTLAHTWIFSNPAALPRAYVVPRLEVVADPDALLERLASPEHRPREVALVEQPPADGFLGTAPPPPRPGTTAYFGSVTLRDRSEVLTLHVSAPAAGFLVLTDQYYPGWKADVNGADAEILRANYAFRAVPVPAGQSVVHFRYQPRSVYLGAAITGATLASLLVAAAFARARPRRRRSPLAS